MSETKPFKLPPAAQRIVDQKLKEANEYLATVDIRKVLDEEKKRKQAAKS